MPNKINLIGQTFGELTVIAEAPPKNKKTYWLCQCSCGAQKEVRADSLKDGSIKTCRGEAHKGINITNQRFGKLTALYNTKKKHGTNFIWKFKCDCGNEIEIDTSHLKTKCDLSCGCDYNNGIIDLLNKKFGKLTVIEYTTQRDCSNSVIWKCKCECGNIVEVTSRNLITGHTKSCGCLRSIGEEKIQEILKNNNIEFEREKTFINCVSNKNKPLRFDFYLPQYNTCIEYDGAYHFPDKIHYSRQQMALEQLERDKIKNKYCLENNIVLIRMPYDNYNNITIQELLPNSSTFIYKGESKNE